MRIRRQLAELHLVSISDAERLDPFAFMGGKVLIAEETADPLEIVGHDVGRFAVIELVAALIGDAFQSVGKVRIAEERALDRGR